MNIRVSLHMPRCSYEAPLTLYPPHALIGIHCLAVRDEEDAVVMLVHALEGSCYKGATAAIVVGT